MNPRQMVRITSLAKTINTFEHALETLVESGVVCQPEEVESFKKGFKTSLNLIRKEYGIAVKEDD